MFLTRTFTKYHFNEELNVLEGQPYAVDKMVKTPPFGVFCGCMLYLCGLGMLACIILAFVGALYFDNPAMWWFLSGFALIIPWRQSWLYLDDLRIEMQQDDNLWVDELRAERFNYEQEAGLATAFRNAHPLNELVRQAMTGNPNACAELLSKLFPDAHT